MAVLQKKDSCRLSATVVIPTYNRPNLAISLAKNIRRFYPTIEIIIVDQECQNPPAEKELKKLKVKYFNLSQANTSKAKNTGIKAAKGEIVIFFDDDVELTKETIKNHLQAYSDPTVVGTAGRVINDYEPLPKHTDVETGKTDFLGTKFLFQFWSTKEQNVDFPYGCNMSFRKSALKKINGFDTRFPKIFEEVDLGHRIQKLGNIKFIPEALVYHHKAALGGIRPEEKLNKQKLIFQNYGYYLAKNVTFPFSLLSLMLRIKTALKWSPSIVLNLVRGYVHSLFVNHPFFFILPIIIFIRLWKAPNFYIFTFAEEWQASLAWEQVKNFHPIWIGMSHANINYYQGPGFIYIHYLLYLISRGDPVILAYAGPILGIITTTCLYYVTKEFFTQKIAIFASLFYGCSTLINYWDRRFWNASFIPIISILFVYSLIKAQKNTCWLILTAVLIGASFHFHIALLLFYIPTFYVVLKNFRKIKRSTWLAMIVIYIILTSPLIVFDLVHNFDNFLAPFRLIFGGGKKELYPISVGNIVSHFHALCSTLGRLWFVKLNSSLETIALETNTHKIQGNLFFSMLSFIALGWFFVKNRKYGFQVFFLSIVPILVAYLIYPSYNPEYYLMTFLTLMPIVIAFSLNSLPNTLSYMIIGIFVTINIVTVLTTTEDRGLMMKKRFIQKAMTVIKDQSFSLEHTGPLPNPQYSYAGWRMLFKAYGKTPVRTNVDQVLGWIYPDEVSNIKTKLHVIVSEEPIKVKGKILSEFREGVYYGYIIENESFHK